MSLFGGNDVHVQEDESEFDDEFDQQRIDEAVANDLPDLSSDDEDFEPSQYHRGMRRNEGASHNLTSSFGEASTDASPVAYHSRIPRPVPSPQRESSTDRQATVSHGELAELRQLYSAAQRRIQDLDHQLSYSKQELEEINKLKIHDQDMATMQLREKDEHLLALRSQLDSSERASYEFSKKCDARETELNQVRQQNDEMQKRIVTQEAQLQSLENELRIAHSDDALTKAKYNHERIVDEMRRQHKELVDDLSEEIRALKNKLTEEEAARKEAQAHSEEVEKNRKRDMIENGETINRLNTLLRQAQQHQQMMPSVVDTVAKKIDFEDSEFTFDGACTPLDVRKTMELNLTKNQNSDLQKRYDQLEVKFRDTREQLQDSISDCELAVKEKKLLEDQLLKAREELARIDTDTQKLKISFEDEKREALVKLEDDLKNHYQKSLSIQSENLRHELNSAKEKQVNALTRELAEKSAEIKELQTSLDEIKNDYVELSRQNTNSESENLSRTYNAELQAKVERAETALKNIELENAALLRRIQANTQPKDGDEELKKRHAREKEQWGKEKRRLESKLRHVSIHSSRSSSPTPSTRSLSTTQTSTPRGVSHEEFAKLQSQFNSVKLKYTETLTKVKAECNEAIKKIKDKNNERLKREVIAEQKRTSEKLREYYKNILGKILAEKSDRIDHLL